MGHDQAQTSPYTYFQEKKMKPDAEDAKWPWHPKDQVVVALSHEASGVTSDMPADAG